MMEAEAIMRLPAIRREMTSMANPVILPPVQPLARDPFTDLTDQGLFAAPWIPWAPPREPLVSSHPDTTPHGQMLSIRHHCLLAAAAHDTVNIRSHYDRALVACQRAIDSLQLGHSPLDSAMLAWVQGVHTLILAQVCLPDAETSHHLATQAWQRLSGIDQPVCGGARADARAALTLAREPAVLAERAVRLPQAVLALTEQTKAHVERHESVLNQRLAGVRERYQDAFTATMIWIMANLLLMVSVPLNGAFAPHLPWSLPFALAVPALWWGTWTLRYRDGLCFFDWYQVRKATALAHFHEAATLLPDPKSHYRLKAGERLAQGCRDHERLGQFYLLELPERLDTLAAAEEAAAKGNQVLDGAWTVEFSNRNALQLRDVLPVEPTMLPTAHRIWFGHASH